MGPLTLGCLEPFKTRIPEAVSFFGELCPRWWSASSMMPGTRREIGFGFFLGFLGLHRGHIGVRIQGYIVIMEVT